MSNNEAISQLEFTKSESNDSIKPKTESKPSQAKESRTSRFVGFESELIFGLQMHFAYQNGKKSLTMLFEALRADDTLTGPNFICAIELYLFHVALEILSIRLGSSPIISCIP